MPKRKYPKLNKEDYNTMYMSVYYYLNRDRLLKKAKRPVICPICGKTMPYSSKSYHVRKFHGKQNNTYVQPKKKTIRYELQKECGSFKINFD